MPVEKTMSRSDTFGNEAAEKYEEKRFKEKRN